MARQLYRPCDALFIDCDGVLVGYDPKAARPHFDELTALGVNVDHVMRVESEWDLQRPLLEGADLLTAITAQLGPKPPVSAERFMNTMFRAGFVRNTAIIDELFSWAAERDIPTFLCTNNSKARKAFLLATDGGALGGLADGIACSSDFGTYKPQPEFYALALDHARQICGAQERGPVLNAILLDDSGFAIKGAQEAGWQAVQVKGPGHHPHIHARLRYEQGSAAPPDRAGATVDSGTDAIDQGWTGLPACNRL